MVGLGRPGMIQERDIAAPKPSFLKEAEYDPWEIEVYTQGASLSFPNSRGVSTLRSVCEMFQIASKTLDEM
jgi:hypothetical protein